MPRGVPSGRPVAGSSGKQRSAAGRGLRGRILARLFAYLPFLSQAADLDAADGMRLDDFGIAGSVLHTPGHTPDSISVILDSGDAVIGDVMMGGYAGGAIRPTTPNFHYFADDLAAAMTRWIAFSRSLRAGCSWATAGRFSIMLSGTGASGALHDHSMTGLAAQGDRTISQVPTRTCSR